MDRSEAQHPGRSAPARFQAALQSIKNTNIRPEIAMSEAPAPKRVAPFAVAIDGEVELAAPAFGSNRTRGLNDDGAAASGAQGTFVVLYDPQGQDNWHGQFRIVTYLEVEVDRFEAADPMLPAVAWTWVVDAIEPHVVTGLSGTVSVVSSSSFGELADHPAAGIEGAIDESYGKSIVQIRASWSPASEQVGPHLAMWAELLATASGLERLPSKIISLEEQRELHELHNNHTPTNPLSTTAPMGLEHPESPISPVHWSPHHPSFHEFGPTVPHLEPVS